MNFPNRTIVSLLESGPAGELCYKPSFSFPQLKKAHVLGLRWIGTSFYLVVVD